VIPLVVATHNRKKAGEMATILGRRFPELEILTLAEFPGAPEPEETGETYAENAVIKAESAFRHTGQLCVADDAGLEIDALPGELGPMSKRFAGAETSFDDKMAIILERMVDVPADLRSARFRCSVAVVGPGVPMRVFEETCEGVVASSPRGQGGFGYDPVFYLPELGRTMAELTADEKHQISHRGKVLRQVAEFLEREALPALLTQRPV
jgi:XTP/dITP diphosphohydrolase